jgi:PAS domain S-box-containing protein
MKLPIVDQVISLVRKPGGAKPRRDREDRLRAGFEVAPAALALASLDGHWLEVNEHFRAMIGYTREELARISFHSITHPDDAKREAPLVRKLIAGDSESYRIDKRIMDKRGRYRTIEVDVAAARNEAGEAEILIYVLHEERPSAASPSARSADNGIAALLEQLTDVCIIRTDERGVITGWNRGAEAMFGYKRDEILGKNRRMLYRDPDSWGGRSTQQLTATTESGRLELEDWRVTRDGVHIWIKSALTPLRPDGVLRGYVEVITPANGASSSIDVKAAHEKKNAELRRRVDTLQADVEQGRRTEESLRDALEQVRVMGEETMNELKIMTVALRKEIDRRKAVEDELEAANARLKELSQPVAVAPKPEPISVEEEIVLSDFTPARVWRSLDGATPADLLLAQASAARSGTLALASGEREKEIFFERGRVFAVASNDASRFLTQRLISLGYITEEQRDRALEIKAETQLALGRILLILGAITEEQLVEVMRAKMQDEVADVLTWTDAKWAFIEGDVPSLQLVPLRIEVPELMRVEAPASSPVPETRQAEAPVAPLVASPKSRKFHRETCNSVKRIGADARVTFASEEEAREAGYEACRLCFR